MRERRTKADMEIFRDQLCLVAEEGKPQSIRHIFYVMTNPRLAGHVSKDDSGYKKIQTELVKLRRSGRVKYDWITDSTRRCHYTRTYDGAGSAIQTAWYSYRQNIWEQTEKYCELWCESRSIAGVLEEIARELAVPLYPTGGFSSLTLAHSAAESILEDYDGREVTIFHVGDYDPSGVIIREKVEEELRLHLSGRVDFKFIPLAITEDQIRAHDLPTNERKPKEKRRPEIVRTCEAEAMPAGMIRDLVRKSIESLIPSRLLETVKAAEESEKDAILDLSNYVKQLGSKTTLDILKENTVEV